MKIPFLKAGFLLCGFLVFAVTPLMAHAIVEETADVAVKTGLWSFLGSGFRHILPCGLDHILFILGLYLLSPKLKTIMWQASAFTVAHSVTLALAMYDVIVMPPIIIEPLISLSIVWIALENIYRSRLKPVRIGIVFLFGLIHGLGFASALDESGLPVNSHLPALVMFNAGVELGQVVIILLAFLLFGKWFGDKSYYRKCIVAPVSILIALIASYWTIERIMIL